MKKSALYYITLVFFLIVKPGVTQIQDDSGLVWLLQGKNNSVFLAGSLHLLSKKNYPLPTAFQSAYKESEVVVFEMHPDSAQTAQAQRLMINIAQYPGGEDLTKNLRDTVLQRLREVCDSLSLNPEQFYPYKPWYVSVALTMAQLQKLGFKSQLGVDHFFFNKAKKDGKEIRGLESFKDQLQLLSELSDLEQEDLLRQTFSQMFTVKTELDSIVHAWYKGDLSSLERTLTQNLYKYPDLAVKFLSQRNKKWIRHILSYLEEKDDFMVIVGSGHFPGKNGLLQLLKDEGFNPVRMSGRIEHTE